MHSSTLRASLVCSCSLVLAVACGDDGGRGGDEADGTDSLTTLTGTDSDTADESGTTLDTTTTDGTTGPMCADEEVECEGVCCEAGQVCFAGACSDDCGGDPPCGQESLCCEGGTVCYL
ncbi:MAG: hypothetical protein KC457_24225, partial [Myxococcales bacterium]|nr:hypothetical protein [Myxococcales bacterium]